MSEDAVLHTTHRAVSDRRPRCRYFSLPELLVVVTVIMIMFALLLPALKEARNVALVAVCMHNMRQCYIALSNYDANYEHLPPARGETGYSIHVLMDQPLPYIRYNFVSAPLYEFNKTRSMGLGLLVEDKNSSLVQSMFCALSDFNANGTWGVDNWDELNQLTVSWAYRGVRDVFIDPETGALVSKSNIAQFEDYSVPDQKAVLADWNQAFPFGGSFLPNGVSHNLRNTNVAYGDGHVNLKNNADDGGYPLFSRVTGRPDSVEHILDCFGDEDNEDNFSLGACP